MSPNPPVENALRELLEKEKHAREAAAAAAEHHRRYAEALDRLATADVDSHNLDVLLQKLLELFVDVARVDVAVIRLREGDRLRSRAAVGLEDEVAAGFSLPLDEGFAGRVASQRGPLLLRPPESDQLNKSEFVRKKGVRAIYCLPLADDDLVGVVYMGAVENRDFSEEDKQLLGVLAVRATAAVVRHRQRETLEDAVRSRDDVLSVVAHDLQNPLNVITLGATALLPRLTDSSARRSVERILKAAQRADRLIRDLLEIGKIESGRFSIERRRVEPADLILSALESQQSLAADASIILASDVSPDLAPVEADEERILEVLENLLSNALKFTQRGGTITVGAGRHGEEVMIWVKDSGSGIGPEELPHIFNRFWQARKKARRGSGLGLTICKAIVEAHGGRIWAESTPAEGTTMFFTIPATAAVRPGTREVANILIVDDRPENLLSLTTILERPEYNLVTARSGEEALSLALRQRFVVALIDVAMPGMSGLDVAVHLKQLERSRDIPIIFITAFGDDPGEIHRAYSAGGADYLVKPLDPEIVRKKVAVFVGLSGRREDNESSSVSGTGRFEE